MQSFEASDAVIATDSQPSMPPAVRPADATKTIGLCMIVKNEAHVILRCLESTRPLIDYVLIEDTGSTDGTQQIIRDWLSRENLPGVVIEERWRDFAYNRSHVLAKLREVKDLDYALIIDADDVLVLNSDVRIDDLKRTLIEGYYTLNLVCGPVIHKRAQLCSNKISFVFRGVVHEFLDCQEGSPTVGHLAEMSIHYIHDGARSLDSETGRRDAQVIEGALGSESDPYMRSRYTINLARSYLSCGELQKALHYFLLRSEMGYQSEEVYISLVQAARLKEALGFDFDDIITTYRRAIDLVPTRAEAFHGASRLCRIVGRNRDGYEIAKPGLDLPMPMGLLIESSIYEYDLLDEFAINSYLAGKYEESLSANLRILETSRIPPDQRPRIIANARFALSSLGEDRCGDAIAVYDDLLARFGAATELPLRELVADALFNKGGALGGLGRYEDAIAAYDDLLARFGAATELPLREFVVKAHFNKGVTLAGLGRSEEAIAAYDDLLVRFDGATELPLRELAARALINKGGRLEGLGRNEDATAAYDDLLVRFGAAIEFPLRELVAVALLNKGVVLGRLGRNEDAIAGYDDLLARFSAATELPLRLQVAKALMNKGVRFGALNRYEDAIATFDDLVARFGAAEAPLSELSTDALINRTEALGRLLEGSSLAARQRPNDN